MNTDLNKINGAIKFFKTALFVGLVDTTTKNFYEIAVEALEKQIPALVETRDWNPSYCPACGIELSTRVGDGYYSHPTFLERCPNEYCSQRLKWD